jgi:ATP-binding cassette subfamily C protein
MLAVVLAGGFFVAMTRFEIPLSQLLVMGVLLARIVSILGKAQQAYQAANMHESAYWSIRHTIAEAEREREQATGAVVPTLREACVFDRVSFGFGSKPVLSEVSLVIPAGLVTAITGPSGAGKTTVADLLLGLYRADAGEITIDGRPLGEIDLLRWRSMVGYVPQEVILFHDTVMANISLGETDISRADAQAALEAAGAWAFVATLPQGIDSVVGERGTLLSGGQRQRIAIARALVRKPVLLILDEATSALDPDTEAEICRNLHDLSAATGLTVLAISHQPAWVETADRVYRLRQHRAEELTAERRRRAAR